MSDKEKLAAWMIQRGYATGHGDTMEELLAELDWQLDEGVQRATMKEREGCAKVCEMLADGSYAIGDHPSGFDCAEAIRARGKE
jgi:glutathione S-transferase